MVLIKSPTSQCGMYSHFVVGCSVVLRFHNELFFPSFGFCKVWQFVVWVWMWQKKKQKSSDSYKIVVSGNKFINISIWISLNKRCIHSLSQSVTHMLFVSVGEILKNVCMILPAKQILQHVCVISLWTLCIS